MSETFSKVERVLAAITALLLFTLNEIRMLHMLPRAPEPGRGQTYSAAVHVFGGSQEVYLSMFDLIARWGLVGLTLALSVWAISETFQRAKA
jgi:hypothetical protein